MTKEQFETAYAMQKRIEDLKARIRMQRDLAENTGTDIEGKEVKLGYGKYTLGECRHILISLIADDQLELAKLLQEFSYL